MGRGAFAGPLVVAACILWTVVPGLKDSKRLSRKQREEFVQQIKTKGLFGLSFVAPAKIDALGLAEALNLAATEAMQDLEQKLRSGKIAESEQAKGARTVARPQQESQVQLASLGSAGSKEEFEFDYRIIIDGKVNFLKATKWKNKVLTKIKADDLVPSVSAASIVAKVARDHYMYALSAKYPHYHFDENVGYGTKTHREALIKYGPSLQHRKSFKPIQNLLGKKLAQPEKGSIESDDLKSENSKSSDLKRGSLAEASVARTLKKRGFVILARNWRRKQFEIDIVAKKANTLYLVEVKYRRDGQRGGGIAAIDARKIKHLRKAAEVLLKHYPAYQVKLLAAAIEGADLEKISWRKIL